MSKKRITRKRCPKCDLPKSAEDYFKVNNNSDGLSSHCKRCTLREIKEYRNKNHKCDACIVSTECPKCEVKDEN